MNQNTLLPISSAQFSVLELTYIPLGGHMPMLTRPYQVNATVEAVDAISNRLHDARSAKLTPTLIADVATDIITPSAVGYVSEIDSGWVDMPRFIFILKVQSIDHSGVETISYIQGYTNYNGISNQGSADPNMMHCINSIIETVVVHVSIPGVGIARKERLYKRYNVISGHSDVDMYAMRPTDIVENMNLLALNQALGDSEASILNVNSYLNSYNNKTLGSEVSNNITTDYLTKVINNGIVNNKNNEIHINSYDQEASVYMVPDPSISDNKFISYLSRLNGYYATNAQFSFSNLMNYDATIHDRFTLIRLNKLDNYMLNTPQIGESWEGRDMLTIKAYSLIEASVAMAIRYGFNKLYFVASNMADPTGQMTLAIFDFNGYINLPYEDTNVMLEGFKQAFLSEVFLTESKGGIFPLHFTMYVDITSTSKISLMFNSSHETWYTAPTAANSLYSPVVTYDKNQLDYTVDNMAHIVTTIGSKTENNIILPH